MASRIHAAAATARANQTSKSARGPRLSVSDAGRTTMRDRSRHASHASGWLVAGGLGILAGYLVGRGATGAYTQGWWPALAGTALGLVGSLAAPARRLAVSSCGAAAAVVTAVATVAWVHCQSGFWPIADEFRVAHFGSTTQAITRGIVVYGALIGVPCVLAAVLVAAATAGGPTRRGHEATE